MNDIDFFSSLKDRSTGSQGAEDAADYILKVFSDAGLNDVGSQEFLLPIPEVASASLEGDGEKLDLYPWGPNLVYLPMTPETGLEGPLLYAADGDFEHFNGSNVKGSIVLMEMSSWENWTNAAMLGASALIFLGDRNAIKGEFNRRTFPLRLPFRGFGQTPETGEKLKKLAVKKAPQYHQVQDRVAPQDGQELLRLSPWQEPATQRRTDRSGSLLRRFLSGPGAGPRGR